MESYYKAKEELEDNKEPHDEPEIHQEEPSQKQSEPSIFSQELGDTNIEHVGSPSKSNESQKLNLVVAEKSAQQIQEQLSRTSELNGHSQESVSDSQATSEPYSLSISDPQEEPLKRAQETNKSEEIAEQYESFIESKLEQHVDAQAQMNEQSDRFNPSEELKDQIEENSKFDQESNMSPEALLDIVKESSDFVHVRPQNSGPAEHELLNGGDGEPHQQENSGQQETQEACANNAHIGDIYSTGRSFKDLKKDLLKAEDDYESFNSSSDTQDSLSESPSRPDCERVLRIFDRTKDIREAISENVDDLQSQPNESSDNEENSLSQSSGEQSDVAPKKVASKYSPSHVDRRHEKKGLDNSGEDGELKSQNDLLQNADADVTITNNNLGETVGNSEALNSIQGEYNSSATKQEKAEQGGDIPEAANIQGMDLQCSETDKIKDATEVDPVVPAIEQNLDQQEGNSSVSAIAQSLNVQNCEDRNNYEEAAPIQCDVSEKSKEGSDNEEGKLSDNQDLKSKDSDSIEIISDSEQGISPDNPAKYNSDKRDPSADCQSYLLGTEEQMNPEDAVGNIVSDYVNVYWLPESTQSESKATESQDALPMKDPEERQDAIHTEGLVQGFTEEVKKVQLSEPNEDLIQEHLQDSIRDNNAKGSSLKEGDTSSSTHQTQSKSDSESREHEQESASHLRPLNQADICDQEREQEKVGDQVSDVQLTVSDGTEATSISSSDFHSVASNLQDGNSDRQSDATSYESCETVKEGGPNTGSPENSEIFQRSELSLTSTPSFSRTPIRTKENIRLMMNQSLNVDSECPVLAGSSNVHRSMADSKVSTRSLSLPWTASEQLHHERTSTNLATSATQEHITNPESERTGRIVASDIKKFESETREKGGIDRNDTVQHAVDVPESTELGIIEMGANDSFRKKASKVAEDTAASDDAMTSSVQMIGSTEGKVSFESIAGALVAIQAAFAAEIARVTSSDAAVFNEETVGSARVNFSAVPSTSGPEKPGETPLGILSSSGNSTSSTSEVKKTQAERDVRVDIGTGRIFLTPSPVNVEPEPQPVGSSMKCSEERVVHTQADSILLSSKVNSGELESQPENFLVKPSEERALCTPGGGSVLVSNSRTGETGSIPKDPSINPLEERVIRTQGGRIMFAANSYTGESQSHSEPSSNSEESRALAKNLKVACGERSPDEPDPEAAHTLEVNHGMLVHRSRHCKGFQTLKMNIRGSPDMVKHLDLSHNEITSLDGLFYFTNLRELVLAWNWITDSGLIEFYRTVLGDNVLLPSLKLLDLRHNRLTNLVDLVTLLGNEAPNLEQLYLMGNAACGYRMDEAIDQDPIYNHDSEKALKRYRLYVISALKKLTFLDFKCVSKRERTKATIMENRLYVVDLANGRGRNEVLDVCRDSSHVQFFYPWSPENMTVLDLSGQRVRNLSAFSKYPNLKTLILDGNKLTDDMIATLPRMDRLETLSLNRNRLSNFIPVLLLLQQRVQNIKYLSLLGNLICGYRLVDPRKSLAPLPPFLDPSQYSNPVANAAITGAFVTTAATNPRTARTIRLASSEVFPPENPSHAVAYATLISSTASENRVAPTGFETRRRSFPLGIGARGNVNILNSARDFERYGTFFASAIEILEALNANRITIDAVNEVAAAIEAEAVIEAAAIEAAAIETAAANAKNAQPIPEIGATHYQTATSSNLHVGKGAQIPLSSEIAALRSVSMSYNDQTISEQKAAVMLPLSLSSGNPTNSELGSFATLPVSNPSGGQTAIDEMASSAAFPTPVASDSSVGSENEASETFTLHVASSGGQVILKTFRIFQEIDQYVRQGSREAYRQACRQALRQSFRQEAEQAARRTAEEADGQEVGQTEVQAARQEDGQTHPSSTPRTTEQNFSVLSHIENFFRLGRAGPFLEHHGGNYKEGTANTCRGVIAEVALRGAAAAGVASQIATAVAVGVVQPTGPILVNNDTEVTVASEIAAANRKHTVRVAAYLAAYKHSVAYAESGAAARSSGYIAAASNIGAVASNRAATNSADANQSVANVLVEVNNAIARNSSAATANSSGLEPKSTEGGGEGHERGVELRILGEGQCVGCIENDLIERLEESEEIDLQIFRYRLKILKHLPNLQYLDHKEISEVERRFCDAVGHHIYPTYMPERLHNSLPSKVPCRHEILNARRQKEKFTSFWDKFHRFFNTKTHKRRLAYEADYKKKQPCGVHVYLENNPLERPPHGGGVVAEKLHIGTSCA